MKYDFSKLIIFHAVFWLRGLNLFQHEFLLVLGTKFQIIFRTFSKID